MTAFEYEFPAELSDTDREALVADATAPLRDKG
jgi:hypothetical protein